MFGKGWLDLVGKAQSKTSGPLTSLLGTSYRYASVALMRWYSFDHQVSILPHHPFEPRLLSIPTWHFKDLQRQISKERSMSKIRNLGRQKKPQMDTVKQPLLLSYRYGRQPPLTILFSRKQVCRGEDQCASQKRTSRKRAVKSSCENCISHRSGGLIGAKKHK